MNTKITFLKTMLFVFAIAGSMATNAQDPDAFVHMRFENSLTATGTSGLTFSFVDNLNGTANLAYLSPGKEGSSTLDFGGIDPSATTPVDLNVPIINNGDDVGIRSTANATITGDDARTIVAWVRYDDDLNSSNGNYTVANIGPGSVTDGTKGRFNFVVNGNQGGLIVIYSNGRSTATFDPANEGAAGSRDFIIDGNWHHVAVSYSGGDVAVVGNIEFYLDGVLYPNVAASAGSLNTGAAPITVATDGGNQTKWFDGGSLDDLRIYDFALTQAQIQNVMNGGNVLSLGDIAFGENELKAFPNAVEDFLYLETTSKSSVHISVFDITGKNIIRSYGKSVDMRALNSGMYIVKVREDNKVANLKILKK